MSRPDANDVLREHGSEALRNGFDGAREYVPNGAELLDEIEAYLKRFVAYPSEAALVAHVLWIAHTHCMNRWDSTPRLAFLSPERGSGKTRALEVTQLLVPRPILAVNVTSAYLFRKISDPQGRPTVLYDEIDTVFGPRVKKDNEEIRAFLNSGHRRGAEAGRCIKKGTKIEAEELESYCAVALAGIGDLPDTIFSRSIVVRMRRRAQCETVQPFRPRLHGPEGEALRERLVTWSGAVEAERDYPEMPEGVEDRDADIWEPLLTIADAAGGAWPQRARVAAVALVALSKEETPSLGVRLLSDLRQVFDDDVLRTETVLQRLHALEESPWKDLGGKALDARRLAKLLKAYEISSTTLRIDDRTPKGYRRSDFHDAWARYLPSFPKKDATSATGATVISARHLNGGEP